MHACVRACTMIIIPSLPKYVKSSRSERYTIIIIIIIMTTIIIIIIIIGDMRDNNMNIK